MEDKPSDAPEASAPEADGAAPHAAAEVSPSPQADGDSSLEAPPAASSEPATKSSKTKEKDQEKKPQFRRDTVLLRAYRSGLPVEGHIEKVIKGGYEVRVRRSRGFCPHSLMGLGHDERPEDLVGKTVSFKITEFRRGGEELILSRRALLEEARSEEAKAVRATLIEGAVTRGHVARITDFGAFIDLGAGVTGLAHVTELAHGRVVHPRDVVHVGDDVSVRILKLDESTGRISLSLKRAEEDPWTAVLAALEVGQVVPAIARRVVDFGAFVELRRGVEALAPAREFPPIEGGFERALEIGATRDWGVRSIDAKRRRIAVAPVPEPGKEAPLALTPGQNVKGRVQKLERFGVFVWLAPGQVGLVPNVWTGAKSATDAEAKFPFGREVEVEVVEVLEEGRRIRLAIAGVPRQAPAEKPRREGPPAAQAAPRRERAERPRREEKEKVPAQAPPASFGTNLGDALRAFVKKDS